MQRVRVTWFVQRKYKETSPPRVTIKQNEGRFGGKKGAAGGYSIEKNDSPGPTSYDIEGSFKKAHDFRGRNIFDKTKRVTFCTTQAKNSISPGPGKHTHSIQ